MTGTSSRYRSLLVFLFFLLTAVLITWPLLPNIADSLYGKQGDPLATVWSIKWFKEAVFSNAGAVWHFPYAAYPHGIKTPFYIVNIPFAPLYAYPHGETVFYNLVILISIALNGYVMFLLGRKLYRNELVAAGMGIIYMFCPYALTRARYHLSLVPIFIFPLLLYALLCLKENYNTANKVKLFFALLLAFNMHPYYTPMALLMLALLAVSYIVKKLAAGRERLGMDLPFIRICLLLCILALLITLPLSYIGIALAKSDTATLSRQEGDLYTYAAHAWNYCVPSPNSFFLGDSVQPFVRERVLSTNIEEFVLFLGYTNLGLALIAIFVWFTRRRIRFAGRLAQGLEGRSWVIPVALAGAITFFLFSLPPTIKLGSLTLYLPSWFTYKLAPSIRVYARFGALVFFFVTILSGACLFFLDKSLVKRRVFFKYLFFFLLLSLILCEFVQSTNFTMQKVYDHPPVYAEVESLPDDAVIAEYPFVASDEAYNYQYLWESVYHTKNMLNGSGLGSEGEMLRNCVLNLRDARTPGLLAYMGAGYVVVHKDFYEKGSEYSYPQGELDLNDLPGGYEIAYQDITSALLKVKAERPQTVVIYDPNFSTVITEDFGNGWWLGEEKKWMVKIDAIEDQTVDIRFKAFSAKGERTLRIDLGLGRIETFHIGEDSQDVVIPGVRLEKGINRIYLSTQEEPVPYKEVFGGYDSKGLCFAMSFWETE